MEAVVGTLWFTLGQPVVGKPVVPVVVAAPWAWGVLARVSACRESRDGFLASVSLRRGVWAVTTWG